MHHWCERSSDGMSQGRWVFVPEYNALDVEYTAIFLTFNMRQMAILKLKSICKFTKVNLSNVLVSHSEEKNQKHNFNNTFSTSEQIYDNIG